MKIKILPSSARPPQSKNEAFLITDLWNDWGEYRTQYYLIVYNEVGEKFEVGSVKIGEYGLYGQMVRPNLPPWPRAIQ